VLKPPVETHSNETLAWYHRDRLPANHSLETCEFPALPLVLRKACLHTAIRQDDSIASFEAIMNSVSSRVCWNALSWFNFNQSDPAKSTHGSRLVRTMVVAMSAMEPLVAQTKAATTLLLR